MIIRLSESCQVNTFHSLLSFSQSLCNNQKEEDAHQTFRHLLMIETFDCNHVSVPCFLLNWIEGRIEEAREPQNWSMKTTCSFLLWNCFKSFFSQILLVPGLVSSIRMNTWSANDMILAQRHSPSQSCLLSDFKPRFSISTPFDISFFSPFILLSLFFVVYTLLILRYTISLV